MSKKEFLKRSYSSVVKGYDENEWEEGGAGESVLKPQQLSFTYKNILSLPKAHEEKSPSKRRKQRSKNLYTKVVQKSPVIIISDTSEEDLSPTKTQTNRIGVMSQSNECLPDSAELPRKRRLFDTFQQKRLPEIPSDSESSSLPDPFEVPLSPDSSITFVDNLKEDNTSSLFVIEDDQHLDQHTQEFTMFYDNDPLLPVYKSLNKGIKTKDAVEILLRVLPEDKLARNLPLEVTKNVSFIYSISTIGHWKNALCDGMGKWVQTGTENSSVCVDDQKLISFSNSDGSMLKVIRRKYINGSSSCLHRIVIMLESQESGEILDHMFVQYYFIGREGTINVNPHGNSKTGSSSYQRTAQTTKQRIQELCKKNSKPKDVFHTVLEEQGGLENAKSGTMLARNKMQISNYKRSVEETVKDPLLQCTDMAKQQEKGDNRFTRVVGAAPEFFIFMSSDGQLAEVNKFCTNNMNFSVLGIDTTFNIGKYFLTVTTYRNLMLKTKDGTEPVMIGPMLLHQRKGFESYFTLASSMLQACPNLKNMKVFGTDGDVNLSNAFQVCFTDSKHLLCDVHMVDNIRKKLKDLNIKGNVSEEYVCDIFGKTTGGIKVKGLVDCTSPQMFEENVELLKCVWKDRHPNGNQFLDYFMEYKYYLIKECMSADIQSMCGLGFPPKLYNQNGNECINNVIKTDAKSKESKDINPFDFVKLVEKSVKRQESEVKLAVIGRGQYTLKEEYRHLKVDDHVYWRKTQVQREAVFKKMLAEPIKPRISDSLDISGDESRSTSSNIISMTANDTGIINIPFPILSNMIEEASYILRENGSIVAVPGQSNKAYYVLDSQKKDPVYVKLSKDKTNITCEKRCHRWNGYKFCSHVIALAQNLDILPAVVAKYKLISRQPNITNMANTNMPSNRGKKGCKATQIRKGPANIKKRPALEYAQREQRFQPTLFHLTFIAGLVKRCYGCGQEFSAANRTPPNDIILKGFDYREYLSPVTKKLKKTPNMQNTYYHLNRDCVRKRYPLFETKHIVVHDEIRNQLSEDHVSILNNLNIAIE